MYRLAALNDVECDGSDGNEQPNNKAPTQQIQESEILNRYNKALIDQRSKNYDVAIEAFKELLGTQFLLKAEPVKNSQELTPNGISPIYGKTDLTIKYACLRNLAEIYRDQKKLSSALEYFLLALEVDGTDVSTWFKVGVIASKLGLVHFAPTAFLTGVKYSSQNLECLDRAAVSLVVEGDYVMAMEVVSRCFKCNPDYQRGFALRDIVLDTHAWLKKDMAVLCPQANLQFERAFSGPVEIRKKLETEISTLESNFQLWRKREAEKPTVYVDIPSPFASLSWQCIGEAFYRLFQWFEEHNESVLQRKVNLLASLPSVEAEEIGIESSKADQVEVMETEPCEPDDNPAEGDNSEADVVDEKRARRKTGSAFMDELLLNGKRRSTRVRASRKEQESLSVADALTNIIPKTLLQKINVPPRSSVLNEDSMDTMDQYKLFEKQLMSQEVSIAEGKENDSEECPDKLTENEGYFGTLQEQTDVKEFIEIHDKQPFLEILKGFVFRMEKSWNKTWPKKLVLVFIDCYQAFRKYYGISPQLLNYKEIRRHTYEESGATLLYHELMIDCDKSCENTLPLQLMHNIVELADFPEEFPDEISHAIYRLRIMWMRAFLFLSRGETSDAICYLEEALNCYTDHPCLENQLVRLCNCSKNQKISNEIVLGVLDAQSRKKSLSEVVRLYKEGSYKEIVDTLRDHVNSAKRTGDEDLGRKEQVNMLINTLYHLDQYKECLSWLETSIHELLNSLKNMNMEEQSQEWKVEFDQILVAMDDCCDWGEFTICEGMAKTRLPRFVQTLCIAICRQLEDNERRPPCASRPWIILNKILVAMEAEEGYQLVVSSQENNSNDGSDMGDIPPSVLVLFTAHQYLGRRGWCNCDGNVLLFLVIDQVLPRLRTPEWSSFRETVQQHLDQAVYCLYAHPSKKNKSRNIEEHNVSPIPLTWDRAIQLFELYRPDETPAFDSLRVNLISADTEVLFRRIASLMPEDIDTATPVDGLKDFIYRKVDSLPEHESVLPQEVRDIFYILGDYHVKTYEHVKAGTYLLTDLVFNCNRMDAWASLALSKMSLLDLTLNSCDHLSHDEFLKEAMSTIRCFEKCMMLDKSVCTLWIEYGSFAYTVHSFCSQKLKLESESLSLEQFEEIESIKTKMLETAKEAFLNANNIWSKSKDEDNQDERWLHYYMLGKIAEKSGDLAYMQYYEKASQLLYDNNAHYPKKISYNAPQLLAIEAMEIYYRAHVCVIKCLELHDGEPLDANTRTLFQQFLTSFANGPFAKQLSKADLMKQKAKELDAAEEAKILECYDIQNAMSDVVSAVERHEQLMEDVNAVIGEMLGKVVVDIDEFQKTFHILEPPDNLKENSPLPVLTALENDVKLSIDKESDPKLVAAEKVVELEKEVLQVQDVDDILSEAKDIPNALANDIIAKIQMDVDVKPEIDESIAEDMAVQECNRTDIKEEADGTVKADVGMEVDNSQDKDMSGIYQEGNTAAVEPEVIGHPSKTDIKPKADGFDVENKTDEPKMEENVSEDTVDGRDENRQAEIIAKRKSKDSVECIDILSSEDEKKGGDVTKEDLDEDMLRMAAEAAARHPDEAKPSHLPSKVNLLKCAAEELTNLPLDTVDSYLEPVFEPYPHEKIPDDNYYYTLEDLQTISQPKLVPKNITRTKFTGGKKRRRTCRERLPSSSSDSDRIDYADESNGNSSSSSSSSSSSLSSSDETEVEISKKRKRGGQRPSRPPTNVVPKIGAEADNKKDDALDVPLVKEITPLDPDEVLLQQCIAAFELCALRFPQHYKSVYRLAHFFYRSKKYRDLEKCRQLLVGSYATPHGNIGGLFAENKNTNFFNGIWRLPSGDVDRPGSFASHMSRSVLLLLEVLRDLRDHKQLLQLCLQLRKVPEPEKKYLREDERFPLSKQALDLSLQSLRHTVKHADVMTLPIVVDAYRVYLRVNKHCPSKVNAFSECLLEAFNRLGKGEATLEQCLKFCHGEVAGNRIDTPLSSLGSKPNMKRPRLKEKAGNLKTRRQTLPAVAAVKAVDTLVKKDANDVKDIIDDVKSKQTETQPDLSVDHFSKKLNQDLRDVSDKESVVMKDKSSLNPATDPKESDPKSLSKLPREEAPAPDRDDDNKPTKHESKLETREKQMVSTKPASSEEQITLPKPQCTPASRTASTAPTPTTVSDFAAAFSQSYVQELQKFTKMFGNIPNNLPMFPTGTKPAQFGMSNLMANPEQLNQYNNFFANYLAQLQSMMPDKNLQQKNSAVTPAQPPMAHSASTADSKFKTDSTPKSPQPFSSVVAKPSSATKVVTGSSSKVATLPVPPRAHSSPTVTSLPKIDTSHKNAADSAHPPIPVLAKKIPSSSDSPRAPTSHQPFSSVVAKPSIATKPVPSSSSKVATLPVPPKAHSSTTLTSLPKIDTSHKNAANSAHPTPHPPIPVLAKKIPASIDSPKAPSKPALLPTSSSFFPPLTKNQSQSKPLPHPSAPIPVSSRTQSQTESKTKFNIEDILSKNPGISITYKGSGQSQAMNLSAKSGNSGEKSSPPSEPAVPPKVSSPEIVTLDD